MTQCAGPAVRTWLALALAVPALGCTRSVPPGSAGESRAGSPAAPDGDAAVQPSGAAAPERDARAGADGASGDGGAVVDSDAAGSGPDCGNGTLEDGEDCDDGVQTALCDADCTRPECGDDVWNVLAGETCDDGNVFAGDRCDRLCAVAPSLLLDVEIEGPSALWDVKSDAQGNLLLSAQRYAGGEYGCDVYKLDPRGELLWRVPVPSAVACRLAVKPGGDVAVACAESTVTGSPVLLELSAYGELLWVADSPSTGAASAERVTAAVSRWDGALVTVIAQQPPGWAEQLVVGFDAAGNRLLPALFGPVTSIDAFAALDVANDGRIALLAPRGADQDDSRLWRLAADGSLDWYGDLAGRVVSVGFTGEGEVLAATLDEREIVVRRFARNGIAVWDEPGRIDDAHADMAVDSAGIATLVSWSDPGDVHLSRFAADGSALSELPLPELDGQLVQARITSGVQGRPIVALAFEPEPLLPGRTTDGVRILQFAP